MLILGNKGLMNVEIFSLHDVGGTALLQSR